MKNKLSSSKNRFIYIGAIFFSILFVLFSRSFFIFHLYNDMSINNLYVTLSKFFTVPIVGYFIIKIKSTRELSFLFILFLLFTSLLVSTFLGGADCRKLIMQYYPMIAMACLLNIICNKKERFKAFLDVLGTVILVLAGINLFIMYFFPNTFGKGFFMGLENQMGFTLIIGCLILQLDRIYNGNRIKCIIYMIIYFISIISVWSASNLLSAITIFGCLYVAPVKIFVKKSNFSLFVTFFIVILLTIIFVGASGVLETDFAKYVVEDFLGKDLTLTGRTNIWSKLLDMVSEKPILGYGVQSNVNTFEMTTYYGNIVLVGRYSAHNQFLQILFEGGTVALVIVFYSAFRMSKILKKYNNQDASLVLKTIALGAIVLLFAEAVTFDVLFCVFSFIVAISKIDVLEKNVD